MTEPKQIELLPCPFCGGKAFLFADNGVKVICGQCGAQSKTLCDWITYEGKPSGNATLSVIEKWNRRAK